MAERSAEVARRFFEEVWNQRRIDSFAELAHRQGVSHSPSGVPVTAEQFKTDVYLRFLDAFPDLHIEIEDILAKGDDAVVRWYATGTHLGDGLGAAASHRQVGFRGMTWFVVRDGQVVEGWDCWDQGGLIQSLQSAS